MNTLDYWDYVIIASNHQITIATDTRNLSVPIAIKLFLFIFSSFYPLYYIIKIITDWSLYEAFTH